MLSIFRTHFLVRGAILKPNLNFIDSLRSISTVRPNLNLVQPYPSSFGAQHRFYSSTKKSKSKIKKNGQKQKKDKKVENDKQGDDSMVDSNSRNSVFKSESKPGVSRGSRMTVDLESELKSTRKKKEEYEKYLKTTSEPHERGLIYEIISKQVEIEAYLEKKIQESTKHTLFEHLSTIPTELIPTKYVPASKSFTTFKSMISLGTNILTHWQNFGQHFQEYKERIRRECKDQLYDPIKFDSVSRITFESEVLNKFITMNESIFKSMLKDHGLEIAGPDPDEKTRGDISIKSLDGESLKHYFCEMKTTLPHYQVVDEKKKIIQSPAIRTKIVNRNDQLVKRVYVDLVDSYSKPLEAFMDLNAQHVTNKVVNQVFNYSKSLRQKATPEHRLYYSMLSTVEVTFLFFYDKNVLHVSPPIEREELFFATHFILLLRYPCLMPNGARELRRHIENVHESLQSADPMPKKSPPIKAQDSSPEQDNTKDKYTISPLELYEHYFGSEVIYSNDNVKMAKFQHGDKWYMIKCCEMYKSPKNAHKEMKQEAQIYMAIEICKRLTSKNSPLPDFIPKFIFYGVLSIFRMIVYEFIDGECYSEFDEMSTEEKKACEKSLQQLHGLGIVHGDVRASNFMIKNAKTSNPTAVVIDFGRSRFEIYNRFFKEEMNLFYQEAKLTLNPNLDPNLPSP